MSKERKPWQSLTPPYQSKLVQSVASIIGPHCHDESDARAVLLRIATRLANDNPDLQQIKNILQHNSSFQEVISGICKLRDEKTKANAILHRASISIDELDLMLFNAFPSAVAMQAAGIPISKPRATTLARRQSENREQSQPSNVGGRPSLVHNVEIIGKVKEVISQNVKESERVAVIGRGQKRRMVIAEHLTSSRYKLWSQHTLLHQHMAFPTFCKVMKIHFPHVRGARRNTDICKHCKHFSKYLVPCARKACHKQRESIIALLPSYFEAFDSNPLVRSTLDNKDDVDWVRRLHRFIHQRNANPRADPERQNLSLTNRLALHSSEARALHTLKPHLDLLEAYEWHRVSARRQAEYLAKLRSSLPARTAVIQMDFKENIKYPLSPDETSEEWHAQNKLSLTVFGANALLPKRGSGSLEVFFLLTSEILDHDAQAADILLNMVLAQVRQLPDADWSSVEKLILVADCGPHFRSYENVAHYCVTLPPILNKTVEICWLGEQHGKSGVDRCFGWCNHWISTYILKNHIYNLDDLIRCFEALFL